MPKFQKKDKVIVAEFNIHLSQPVEIEALDIETEYIKFKWQKQEWVNAINVTVHRDKTKLRLP